METAEKKQKHVVISEALDSLRTAVTSLEDLRGKVSGVPLAAPAVNNEPVLPLGDFLGQAPAQIKTQAKRIEEITQELNDLLF